MPIYEFLCQDCGATSEWLFTAADEPPTCKACGSAQVRKVLSPTSPLTGSARQGLPGPGDRGCCGNVPGQGGCAGPGSCCGKRA